MNKDRIQRFIQLLKDDAENPTGVKFDMGVWTLPEGVDSRYSVPAATKEVKVNCGTHACALGLAAISGVFKDEGLGFKVHIFGRGDVCGMLVPTFGDYQEYDAGAEFFDITRPDAEMLFDNCCYHNTVRRGKEAEMEVVKRLEFLLEHGSLQNYVY